MTSTRVISGLVFCTLLAGLFGLAFSEVVWDEDSQSYITPPSRSDYTTPQRHYNTDQPRLLWDDMHDSDGDDLYVNYSNCRLLMDSLGIVAIQISAGQFNQAMLDSFDILVLIDAEVAYTMEEIQVVQGWVNSGGILFMIGEGSSAFNLASNNGMIQPYNMVFSSTITDSAYNFAAHPITQGLNHLNMPFGSAIIVSTPAVELGWDLSNNYTLAINESGVVALVFNDSNMMQNNYLTHGSNHQCMINTFTYLIEASAGLTVTLTPHNPPIQIPAGGGNFTFDAIVENAADSAITFDAWTMVILPNGAAYGPIIRRDRLVIPSGATIMRVLNQYVPMSAPPGNYQYAGYVGVYPDSVVAEDSFAFAKFIGEGVPAHNQGWNVYGWEDTGRHSSTPEMEGYVMLTASPNPFNPATQIEFTLPEAARVSLRVYDVKGRLAGELLNGWLEAGSHNAAFDAAELPTGIYFARLKAGNEVRTQKLLLVK